MLTSARWTGEQHAGRKRKRTSSARWNLTRAISSCCWKQGLSFPGIASLGRRQDACMNKPSPSCLTTRSLAFSLDLVSSRKPAIVAAWRKQLESVAEQGPEAARTCRISAPRLQLGSARPGAAEKAVALIPAEGIANSFDEAAVPREYCVGRTAWLFGNKELARTALTDARAIFERTTREQPDYPQAWSYLGLTDAMLGRRSEAIQEGKRACETPSVYQGLLDRSDIRKSIWQ